MKRRRYRLAGQTASVVRGLALMARWCAENWKGILPFAASRGYKRLVALAGSASGCSSGVEHNLAKVGVEGSNPFARSSFPNRSRAAEHRGFCRFRASLNRRVKNDPGSARLLRGYKFAEFQMLVHDSFAGGWRAFSETWWKALARWLEGRLRSLMERLRAQNVRISPHVTLAYTLNTHAGTCYRFIADAPFLQVL